jgi:predicted RNase H-like HicB family nuclease
MVKPKFISLKVEFYKEGETFVAYAPMLKISTYANNFEKAKERFEALLEIYLEELEEKGTLEEVFIECGWTKHPGTGSVLMPPVRIAEEEVRIPCPA